MRPCTHGVSLCARRHRRVLHGSISGLDNKALLRFTTECELLDRNVTAEQVDLPGRLVCGRALLTRR